MFEFVSKEHYWNALKSGHLDVLEEWQTRPPDLKHIQDAIAMEHLGSLTGKAIAEIGGGLTRILPVLTKANNTCFNIDPMEGKDLGPVAAPDVDGVVIVPEYLGTTPSSIADESYDVVFSVSVVEHIANETLPEFFEECVRILRPGGLLLHLIDVYLCDDAQPTLHSRMKIYRAGFDHHELKPLHPPTASLDPVFRCTFATNPDVEMLKWNRIAPSLAAYRAYSQSCVLGLAAHKRS